MSDPVDRIDEAWPGCQDQGYAGPGWYFWDETWSGCYGPYATEAEAREKLRQYVEEVLK